MKKRGWATLAAVLLVAVLLQGCLSPYGAEARYAAANERKAKSLEGMSTSGEAKIGDYTWRYTTCGNRATITGVSPATGALEIPPEITVGGSTYLVTSIGSFAFDNACGNKKGGDITSVRIPDSVTSVGNFAFQSCRCLAMVKIGTGWVRYNSSVFNGCTGLMSFDVAKGNPSYASMNGLLLTKDGKTLVRGVNGDVMIPNTVTSIRGEVFHDCHGLMSINVADGNSAYSSVNGLLLTKDGKTLVRGVNGDVAIPDGVRDIGAEAFAGCAGLTGVTMPDSVTNIGRRAFGNCCSLKKVTISDGVKSIGKEAFAYCESLTEVAIPARVAQIGGGAFVGCRALKDFVVASNGADYVFADGLLLSKDGKTLVAGVVVKGEVTIPDSVTSIGDGAFSNCGEMTDVKMPNGVTNIGNDAFSYCHGLKSVTIPDSVTRIGRSAFYLCSFASVTIPDSVTSVGDVAFYACHQLKRVTIGKSVKELGTFSFSNCNSLKSVTFLGDAPTLGNGVFRSAPSDCTIYVQKNSRGWGGSIPGRWKGLRIDYSDSNGEPKPGVDQKR